MNIADLVKTYNNKTAAQFQQVSNLARMLFKRTVNKTEAGLKEKEKNNILRLNLENGCKMHEITEEAVCLADILNPELRDTICNVPLRQFFLPGCLCGSASRRFEHFCSMSSDIYHLPLNVYVIVLGIGLFVFMLSLIFCCYLFR